MKPGSKNFFESSTFDGTEWLWFNPCELWLYNAIDIYRPSKKSRRKKKIQETLICQSYYFYWKSVTPQWRADLVEILSKIMFVRSHFFKTNLVIVFKYELYLKSSNLVLLTPSKIKTFVENYHKPWWGCFIKLGVPTTWKTQRPDTIVPVCFEVLVIVRFNRI